MEGICCLELSDGLLREVFSLDGSSPTEELLGLSVFVDPGIFDLIDPFNDAFADSFVSDLLKEGYWSRAGPFSFELLSPFSPFEGWFPMLT